MKDVNLFALLPGAAATPTVMLAAWAGASPAT